MFPRFDLSHICTLTEHKFICVFNGANSETTGTGKKPKIFILHVSGGSEKACSQII